MDSLLNWVGQGVIVALAVTALLAVARAAPARGRSVAAGVALLVVLLLPLAALQAEWARDVAGRAGLEPGAAALVALPSHWWTSDWLVCALWGVWSAVASVRMMAGMRALGRTRRFCQAFPADVEAQLSQWQAVRTTGRRARLVLSDAVRTAAVFGGRTPLIAVAPALVDTLSVGDLDRVVVHEWAHVQWRDDRAHVLQAWIRVIAGWHPAVWWLDRQLHFEREVACDEYAVRLTGSARAYASCLATLAGLPANAGRALPVVGTSAGSHVRRRVTRVLSFGTTTTRRSRLSAGFACVFPVAIAAIVADVRMVASPTAALVVDNGVGSAPAEIALVSAQDSDGRSPHGPSAPDARAAGVVARRDVSVRREPTPARESKRRPADLSAEDPPREDAVIGAETWEPDAGATAGPSAGPLASGAHWPLTDLRDGSAVVPATPADVVMAPKTSTLWSAAATGGVAIGRGSQKAATSTAGFFARVGQSIAGSF